MKLINRTKPPKCCFSAVDNICTIQKYWGVRTPETSPTDGVKGSC